MTSPVSWLPPSLAIRPTQAGAFSSGAPKTGTPVPSAHLLFEVHANTSWGDTVAIVGGTAALGNWSPQQAVLMRTHAALQPVWHAWVPAPLPACEYKFVIVRAGGDVIWESIDNRHLAPMASRVAAIFDHPASIDRTTAMDAELIYERHRLGQEPDSNGSSMALGGLVPTKPMPQPSSLVGMPPMFTLGSSVEPYYPPVSVEESPCPSRASSRAPSQVNLSSVGSNLSSTPHLQRTPSKSCLSSVGSNMADATIRRSNSRVSFSQELNNTGARAIPLQG